MKNWSPVSASSHDWSLFCRAGSLTPPGIRYFLLFPSAATPGGVSDPALQLDFRPRLALLSWHRIAKAMSSRGWRSAEREPALREAKVDLAGALTLPRNLLRKRRTTHNLFRVTKSATGGSFVVAPSPKRFGAQEAATQDDTFCPRSEDSGVTRPRPPVHAPCVPPSSWRLRSERPGCERRARPRVDDGFSLLPESDAQSS